MKLQRQLHSPQLDHWIIIPIWLCLFLPRFSLASGTVARWRAYSYYTFLFFPGLSCGSPCLWNSQWNQICMSTSVLLEERRRIIFFPLRHCVISQWFFSILTLSYQFKVYSLQRAVDSINNDTTGQRQCLAGWGPGSLGQGHGPGTDWRWLTDSLSVTRVNESKWSCREHEVHYKVWSLKYEGEVFSEFGFG